MKISVFYDHVSDAASQTGRPVGELLKECRAMGIDAVELGYGYLSEDYDNIRAQVKAAGLGVSCIYYNHDFNFDPDIASSKLVIERAEELNCHRILAIPGFLNDADAQTIASLSEDRAATAKYMAGHPEIQNMRRALADLAACGAQHGVTVTLEDYDADNPPFARVYELEWFMQNVPGLRFTLDTGNFAYSDEDVLKGYDVLKDYIVHVHCKDRLPDPDMQGGRFNRGLDSVEVGGGYIPVSEIIARLKAQGYDGYLAMEHFNNAAQLEMIRKSAEFLKKSIA